ncbi:prolipoprotein diacylglyceryl transferase [Sphingomonas sinipercae]|uniref:Phosphatidylglycerol--prolipoprotein diacylglyceryl transferase n=1 Tax=Sphingomonas sinipercae TaxID=2714944 RepID=A0A6G7ZL95_9SPHN|nr:prolipoprotein diacylglyceryl transferase [Sphingomonas sinipercae]QIL01767.1 prolipoprotein diacylglyceryl transferase [Sphingomonas sinipercae]
MQAAIFATAAIAWADLHLNPVALDLGFFQLRWYSMAYIAGVALGYYYMVKLLAQPGAPMARRHADDLIFYASLGILLGGRIGYVLFYNLDYYIDHPGEVFRLWDGGMSFHGGLLGTVLAVFYLSLKNKLSPLRVHDYVACVAPLGLFLGRLANFVNAELWGAPTNVPWAVRFPEVVAGASILGPPRHPTQLYEALLEGVALFAILWWMFWKTDARYKPGMLVGAFGLFYGLFRFLIEFVREPDAQLVEFARVSGLHMGQWLSLPLILGGVYLMATASKRRVRVEPTVGTASVS